jgi:hypothetical protein
VVVNARTAVLIACFVFSATRALGQPPEAKKEIAILELGGAASRSLSGGVSGFGGDIAVEVTPIEHWLELEGGVTPLFARHSREWDTDFLFKKPWSLSPRVEFMAGVGAVWIHVNQGGAITNSAGFEAVGDFMFWRGRKRKLGWFLEPAYDRSFGRGHEQSLGASFGILISIP